MKVIKTGNARTKSPPLNFIMFKNSTCTAFKINKLDSDSVVGGGGGEGEERGPVSDAVQVHYTLASENLTVYSTSRSVFSSFSSSSRATLIGTCNRSL